MKKIISKYTRLVICLSIAILALSTLTGCQGAGETKAEVKRRHNRVYNTNLQRLQDDIDTVLLIDRPNRLSSKHIR